MKVALVFVLLFATVLCRPARKVLDSGSDSSEEVVKRPEAPAIGKQPLVQKVVVAAAAGSEESTETSEEDAAATQLEVKADGTDAVSATDAPVNSSESEDSDDDDDDDDETEESNTEEEESSDSSDSESGEASTPAPGTVTPVVVTVEPTVETTVDTILPTIVTDTDQGRGDSLGGYPSDYKSIIYVEEKTYHKVPVPYKSYEFIGTGKKMAYDMTGGNEVEKSPKMYKALQIHSDLLEEDTSTPEVESQGLDVSFGTPQDQDMSPRQAALPEEEQTASASDATASDATASDATTSESGSSSTPEEEEEEEESTSTSASASASKEEEDEESQSSEEATATPGAADSDSDESDSIESDSDEEGAGPDTTTDVPVVITAK